jgi:hypothetical protein
MWCFKKWYFLFLLILCYDHRCIHIFNTFSHHLCRPHHTHAISYLSRRSKPRTDSKISRYSATSNTHVKRVSTKTTLLLLSNALISFFTLANSVLIFFFHVGKFCFHVVKFHIVANVKKDIKALDSKSIGQQKQCGICCPML